MDMLAQVIEKVNSLFDERYLEELGRKTGFMKRKRKVTPKQFLQNMIFLRVESSHHSLDDFVHEFYKEGIRVSKQALNKKFNASAVQFVESVLDHLLRQAMSEQAQGLGVIPFVSHVRAIDSSEIRLNKALKDLFPQVRQQGAAIKLQALMDVVNHQLLSLEIRPSKEPDQGYKAHLSHVQAGELWMGDLGYFCVDSFKEIEAKGGYFLSRHFKRVHVYEVMTGKLLNLRARLTATNQEKMTFPIALGACQFSCRLVAIKLPEGAYQQRLKNLLEKKRKDPRCNVKPKDVLNQWTIFVTNLPLSVEADSLLRLYSLRWQLELLFKMMKTFLNLRAVESVNQHRTTLALYSSLISMTLLSFIAMTLVDKEISLYKASKVFIKHIRELFYFINHKIGDFSWFRELLYKFALKESRLRRPSTKRSLEVNYA